jgi:hypothetical protein
MKTAEHTQTDKESFLSSWILLLTESASTCLWGDIYFIKIYPRLQLCTQIYFLIYKMPESNQFLSRIVYGSWLRVPCPLLRGCCFSAWPLSDRRQEGGNFWLFLQNFLASVRGGGAGHCFSA